MAALRDTGKRYGDFPVSGGSLLLHSCCAPCSGDIMNGLRADDVSFTVYFCNPNIHPAAEYERRKDENKRYCEQLGVPFIDADYDVAAWNECVQGHADDPERGARCSLCFSLRLQRTAQYAHETGFAVIATTLGLSRHKNQAQVYACGAAAVQPFDDVTFWPVNWRAADGVQRADALAKAEGFYRQDYCGCAYSLRDTLKRRAEKAKREGA